MKTIGAVVLCFQLNANFPSWTSRVRSPSPAFSFKELRAFQFWKYSKYSVKGMMLRISALSADNARCKQSYLSARFGRVFVTASVGSQPFGPRCAVSANSLEVGYNCELQDERPCRQQFGTASHSRHCGFYPSHSLSGLLLLAPAGAYGDRNVHLCGTLVCLCVLLGRLQD
jgi:hypothetical protein